MGMNSVTYVHTMRAVCLWSRLWRWSRYLRPGKSYGVLETISLDASPGEAHTLKPKALAHRTFLPEGITDPKPQPQPKLCLVLNQGGAGSPAVICSQGLLSSSEKQAFGRSLRWEASDSVTDLRHTVSRVSLYKHRAVRFPCVDKAERWGGRGVGCCTTGCMEKGS